MKRTDYICWNDYFMNIAILSAMRSKDPSTQVGCCIVNNSNRIVSVGYNGLPNRCNDDDFPWEKNSSDPLENKYLFVVHAEANSLMNLNQIDLSNCSMFTTLFPCNECAKLIIQSGIRKIYFLDDKYKDDKNNVASKKMFDCSGVIYEKITPVQIISLNKVDVAKE